MKRKIIQNICLILKSIIGYQQMKTKMSIKQLRKLMESGIIVSKQKKQGRYFSFHYIDEEDLENSSQHNQGRYAVSHKRAFLERFKEEQA